VKRISTFRYSVVNGEIVTIEITPIGVGPQVVAAQNGKEIPNSGTSNRTKFEFTVDEVPGNHHFAKLAFQFVGDEPPDARFEIQIRGSAGGTFAGRPVRKTHQVKDPTYTFLVENPS
jgi:hypothetical protein